MEKVPRYFVRLFDPILVVVLVVDTHIQDKWRETDALCFLLIIKKKVA